MKEEIPVKIDDEILILENWTNWVVLASKEEWVNIPSQVYSFLDDFRPSYHEIRPGPVDEYVALSFRFFRILSRKEELELKIESLAQKMKIEHFIDPKKYKDGDKEAKRFSSYSGWFDSTNGTDKLHTVEFISVLDRISKISSAFLLILQDMISDDGLAQEPRGELQHLFASMVGMQDVVVWDLVTGTIFSYLSNEIRNQIFSNLGYQKESK